MRPKKSIIIYSADPNWASEWALVLDIHGYRVGPCSIIEELQRMLLPKNEAVAPPDGLLLLVSSAAEVLELVNGSCRTWPGRPVVIQKGVRENGGELAMAVAHVYCVFANEPRANVLDGLKLATARKRGPQKRSGAAKAVPPIIRHFVN